MREENKTTHFGNKTVALKDKQGMVNAVFDGVAARYDLMNDLMSFGAHRLWKDVFVTALNPPKQGNRGYRVLDMAGGSGDIARRIIEQSHGYANVVVSDINAQMLGVGKEKAKSWRYPQRAEFIVADAQELPFEAASFDAYTISFGIRNVPQIELALKEAFRVLKRGGRFLCLEFSNVDVPLLNVIYEKFSHHVIPQIGEMVSDDKDSYQYLIESIEQFPNSNKFSNMIREAGFSRVSHTPLTGNIAAIHSGWKI
jgi:demethylmenaquinone methyltransferase/2-methoxy-6-polyprenyl-1,4-benzoquinol methylase